MNIRIKELRTKYNLTQNDLARIVNFRRETIMFLEKGKNNSSLKLAYDKARALKVKIEDVFLFSDD